MEVEMNEMEKQLHAQLPADGSPKGNGALRVALGWSEAEYETAKEDLLEQGIVVKGRGRGGSLQLASANGHNEQLSLLAEPRSIPYRKVARKTRSPKEPKEPKATKPKKTPKPEKDKSLETWIWDAACSIRGAKDAPKYKDYILPLIFTKRLCDVFDDELDRIAARWARGRKPSDW